MSRSRRYPPSFKAEAIQLRRKGYSLDELSGRLQMPKTTVQGWVKSIPLPLLAQRRIRSRIRAAGRIGRPLAIIANRRKIEAWKQGIREKSQLTVNSANLTPSIGKLLCAVLYICEGAKYPSTRALRFGNSDPRMIRAFIQLLRHYFAIDERKLRGEVGHRYDQSQESLIHFWSKVTEIPENQFYRRKADPRTKDKKTKRRDYKGVCVVQYFDTTLQFTLQSMGEILMEENGGAGGNRTLNPSMPWRYDPISPQPRGV